VRLGAREGDEDRGEEDPRWEGPGHGHGG
jgi:hypothetical protein